MVKPEDKIRLRELGKQFAGIAALPVQEEKRKLWTAMNGLKAVRPLVHVRDYPYFMLEYKNELTTTIENPFLKDIEQTLLLRIYEWNHLRVDRVMELFIECPVVFSESGFGLSNKAPFRENVNREDFNTAKHYEPVIGIGDDIDKIIKMPLVEYDEDSTKERLNLLKEIFHDIIPVRLCGGGHFHHIPMDDIIRLTGIDEAMTYLATEPEFMHALLDKYNEVQISRIRQHEKLGILSSNNSYAGVGANCPGYTDLLPPPTESGIGARIGDIWGSGADQIMTAVSPAMTKEFCFDHENVWAQQFKLFSYGCCERLDNKLEFLMTAFPNLRKVSSSPFSDLEKAAELLGSKYVISFKPNSTYLATEKPETELLRQELIHGCLLAEKHNLNLVFNMKTMISLHDEPERLWNWCDMAMEIITAHFG